MKKIICVAAGQEKTRKFENTINRKHLYLNYGLLSLASRLKRFGLEPIQIQGNFDPADSVAQYCVKAGLMETKWPILLSVPSFYALSWARRFVLAIKRLRPEQKIIVGGRWVVGDYPDRLSEFLGGVDLVVPGLGEPALTAIINRFKPAESSAPIATKRIAEAATPLDYSVLKERFRYQPSIEIARGCGMGCNFCQEKDERLTPLKRPEDIVSELQSIIMHDQYRPMTPYFEASIFAPNRRWAFGLRDAMVANEIGVEWRSEARVDSIMPDVLEPLAESGLKVIDLGLESANPKQLIRMSKTKNPERYLTRASAVLRKAYSLNIDVKINILLFAGETLDTIKETVDWLGAHRQFISGISVGPVMAYGWPEAVHSYIDELKEYGASLSSNQNVYGIHQFNLSSEIDFEYSIELSQQISRSFMTTEQYFKLKSFSYFPRDYTYDMFCADLDLCSGTYSFSTDIISELG